MRTSARLFVSLFGLAIVAGCSSTGGGNLPGVVGDGLSGGSVPRGGDVDVQVVVSPVAAEAAGVRQTAWQAVVGAFLALTDEAGAIHRAVSSTDGRYTFTGIPEGDATLQVQPPAQYAGYGIRTVPVRVSGRSAVSLIVWLDVVRPDLRVDSLTVAPSAVRLRPGQQVTFEMIAEGASLDGAHPIWGFHGTGGSIDPNGVFTATGEGGGIVTVMLGVKTAHASVVIAGP